MSFDPLKAYKNDIGSKQYSDNYDKIDWKAEPKKKESQYEEDTISKLARGFTNIR